MRKITIRNIIPSLKNNSGLTLAELLLTAVITAFVFAGILALFLNCILLDEQSRSLSVATTHAKFALEEMKNSTFATIANATWNAAAITTKGLTPLNSETITIAVSGTRLKDVTATVNWMERGSRPRVAALETLIAEL